MPQSTLSLKATVTRRKAEPVPPDMAERLEQLRHHQATEVAKAIDAVAAAITTEPGKARQAEQGAATGPAPEKFGRQVKREAHALQTQFLSSHLGQPVTVFLINGVKLTGKIRQFDQFTILLQGPDGIDSFVFKHAVSTIAPGAA